jgi:hypothetical protein
MTASRFVIAAFVGFWSISVFAQSQAPAPPVPPSQDQQSQPAGAPGQGQQNQTPGTPGQGQANPPDANAPKTDTGGMPDAEKAPLTGPDIVDDPNATPEQKASAEYSGPAVLSRGISASEPMNPKNTKFLPLVGLEYTNSGGLTGVGIQPNGTLQNASSSGVLLSYGLTGQKVFRKDIFSLSFYGNVNHYFAHSNYDGSSDTLSLTWRHNLSRHLSFGVVVSALEYNQNTLLTSGANYINSGVGTTLLTATPATEVFDGRVFSFFTQGDITYQFNSRLSINLSGAGFMTRRSSSSLYGDVGSQAGADLAYRITRRITAGAYYSYTDFDFIGVYGATNVNTVGFTYSIAFDPHTELSTRVGGSRVETTGLSSIPLNPLLSLVFGTGSVLEAVYQVNYTPDVTVELRHKVRNLSLSLAYARGVTPGNGIILTSVRQSGSLGVNYSLGRKWNINTTSGYDSLSGFGSTNQKYASVFFNGGVFRKVYRNIDWHSRFDFHHYTFDNTGFLRNTYTVSTGFVWTPGNLLERIW